MTESASPSATGYFFPTDVKMRFLFLPFPLDPVSVRTRTVRPLFSFFLCQDGQVAYPPSSAPGESQTGPPFFLFLHLCLSADAEVVLPLSTHSPFFFSWGDGAPGSGHLLSSLGPRGRHDCGPAQRRLFFFRADGLARPRTIPLFPLDAILPLAFFLVEQRHFAASSFVFPSSLLTPWWRTVFLDGERRRPLSMSFLALVRR